MDTRSDSGAVLRGVKLSGTNERKENEMTTRMEAAEEAFYERVDRGRPACAACERTDRVTDVQICVECGNGVCVECSNEAYWELEACSEVCARAIARKLAEDNRRLRAQLMRREVVTFTERRAA